MKIEKRERLKALYELERLVYKKNKTDEEKQEIKRLRFTIDSEAKKKSVLKSFVLEEYLEVLNEMPESTDVERARKMGITVNQLNKGKRKYGLQQKKKSA